MRTSVRKKKKTEDPIWEFYKMLGVYFNAVHAVFLEIIGDRQTDRQTDIQKVYFVIQIYELYKPIHQTII